MSPNDNARDEARVEFLDNLRQSLAELRDADYTRDAAYAYIWQQMQEQVDAYIIEVMQHAPPEQLAIFKANMKYLSVDVLEEAFATV